MSDRMTRALNQVVPAGCERDPEYIGTASSDQNHLSGEQLAAKPSVSRFVHRFDRGDTSAFYHSLFVKAAYLPRQIADHVAVFDGSVSLQNALDALPSSDRNAVASALPALIENRMLLGTPDTDDNVLRSFKSQLHPPHVNLLYLIVTTACTFSCSYCFMIKSKAAPKTVNRTDSRLMSVDTAVDGLRMAFRCQRLENGDEPLQIVFYGGEPLLNIKAIRAVLDEINASMARGELVQRPNAMIITNGSLFTDEIATLFKENSVQVAFSIDGDATTNDQGRISNDGMSAYAHVERAISCCRRNELGFGVSVTLTPSAVAHFDDVMRTIRHFRPQSVGFNLLFDDPELHLPFGYAAEATALMIGAFDEVSALGILEDRVMRKVRAFAERRFYPFDCGAAGGNQIVVAPDGEVGICHGFLRDRRYFVTDVHNREFVPSEDPVFLEWAQRTPINMPECQTCFALGLCGGGCPMNAAREKSSIRDMDRRACAHSKLIVEWLVWRLYDRSSPPGIDPIPRSQGSQTS